MAGDPMPEYISLGQTTKVLAGKVGGASGRLLSEMGAECSQIDPGLIHTTDKFNSSVVKSCYFRA